MYALPETWRADAACFRRYGAEQLATMLETCAADLESSAREYAFAALTLEEAARESGYSYSAIQKKLAAGELENVGAKGSPRVRRGALPRKGRAGGQVVTSAY